MGQRVRLTHDDDSTMDSEVDSVGTVNPRLTKNAVYWPNDQKVSTPTKFNGEDSGYTVKEFKFAVESFIMNHPPVSEGPILDYLETIGTAIWRGHDDLENSWQPLENVLNAQDLQLIFSQLLSKTSLIPI